MKNSASGIHILKQDPAETFRELSETCHTGTVILGCTKGAAAFVMGELARREGSKILIYGEHRYLPGKKIQHTLKLTATSIEKTNPAENWSSAMAIALSTDIYNAAGRKKQVITTNMSRPATSPDYLVTWGILP